MRGILEGMGLTFSHLFRPKVTRLYPYEKPKLPPRSRGLIQLIAEEGLQDEFNLKCESCLLCEKACPPRAITIEYEPMHDGRTTLVQVLYPRRCREVYSSQTATGYGRLKGGFYKTRISEYAVEYFNKPVTSLCRYACEGLSGAGNRSELGRYSAEQTGRAKLALYPALLDAVMDIYGYLPLHAAKRIVQARGVDLSDLFGIATMSPKFKPAPAVKGIKRDDQPVRGLAPRYTRSVGQYSSCEAAQCLELDAILSRIACSQRAPMCAPWPLIGALVAMQL